MEIVTELDQKDFETSTGLTIGGKRLDKHLSLLTLDDVLMADEFVNEHGEKGGQLMEWFTVHVSTRCHRVRWTRVAHLDTHLGGLANGSSARHNTRSLVAGAPVQAWGCLLPRSGFQGGVYPSKESMLRAVGNPQDLVPAAVFLLMNRRVEVKVPVGSVPKKKYTTQVIGLKDVVRITPGVVY